MDSHNQDFFQKLGHFFPISEKGQGRTPSPTPSSYAYVKCGSDNYKTLPNLFVIFDILVALFPTFFILFLEIISPVIKIKFLERRI